MKKTALLYVLLVFGAALTSCKKEGCMDPEAVNYNAEAKKDDGTCVFPVPDHRLAIEGYYITKDSMFIDGVHNGNNTHTLHVYFDENDVEPDRIFLQGIWGSDKLVNATYTGGVFIIPTQSVETGYTINGSGQFFGNTILYETEGTATGGYYIEHKGEGTR